MTLKRLDLPDGQWADLLVKPKHEDYVAIMEAAEEAERGLGSMARWYETVGQRYCKAWSVRGGDGQALDVADWSQADPDITDAICIEALNRWDEWQERRVPLVVRRPRSSKSPTRAEPSASTPEASPSA